MISQCDVAFESHPVPGAVLGRREQGQVGWLPPPVQKAEEPVDSSAWPALVQDMELLKLPQTVPVSLAKWLLSVFSYCVALIYKCALPLLSPLEHKVRKDGRPRTRRETHHQASLSINTANCGSSPSGFSSGRSSLPLADQEQEPYCPPSCPSLSRVRSMNAPGIDCKVKPDRMAPTPRIDISSFNYSAKVCHF